MRVPRTLSFYIGRELAYYSVLGLLGVGSILVTQNLLRQIEDLASIGLRFGDLGSILVAILGMLSAYLIPVAFLFGVLVTMARLSSDAELSAMRSLGIGLAQLAVPFLALAVVASAGTWWLLNHTEPAGRRQLKGIAAEIVARGGWVEPGRFHRLGGAGERLIFVDGRDPKGELSGVLVSDRTNADQPFLVTAERGRLRFDLEARTARLLLEEGGIDFEPLDADTDAHRRVAFTTFDYGFGAEGLIGGGPCRILPAEMSTDRIEAILDYFRAHEGKPPDCARVKTAEHYEIQLHRRRALPFAPVVFALLGIGLGMRRARGARSWGVFLCIGLGFSYYALLSFGVFLARDGLLPASVALWVPNLVLTACAVPLLARARRAEV